MADEFSPAQVTLENFAPVPKKRRPFSWSVMGLILLAFFLVYIVIVPAISSGINQLKPQPVNKKLLEMTFAEYLRLHAMSGVIMLIFLSIGASVGSFLNVVIYRLPRRGRLFWPPSACPNCGNKIRGSDNIPILGWIGLRGKCRNCSVRISSRYPIIELIVAIVFVVLYYDELLSGGRNLPIREPNTYAGIVWILLYTKWDLLSIYFLHTSLLSVLLAWGMINYDRFRVPQPAVLAVLFVSAVCVSAFPHLNPTSAPNHISSLFLQSIITAVAGLVVGAISGYTLQHLFVGGFAELQHSQVDPQVSDAIDSVDIQPSDAKESAEPAIQVSAEVRESITEVSDAMQATQQGEDPTTQLATAETLAIETTAIDQEITLENNIQVAFTPKDLYGSVSPVPQFASDAIFSMSLVGVVLGPSAALFIGLLVCLIGWIWSLLRFVSRRRFADIPISLPIFFVSAVFIALWRQTSLIPLPWLPRPESSPALVTIWTISVLALGIAIGQLRKPQPLKG